MLQGGTVKPPKGEAARARIASLLDNLESALEATEWVAGEAVSIADFAVYHPLWLHVLCNRKPLDAGPRVMDWYRRVAAIGHGQRQEIAPQQVFKIAHEAEPRALPDAVSEGAELLGASVAVAPSDYGMVPVTGRLVHQSHRRIVLARETADFGLLHVHFPRQGYSLKPV